jgi:DNA-binding Lrp family transcriptional regulator
MVHAYVTVITGTGASPAVVEALRALDHVTEAHVITGAYDVLIELEVDDVSQILDLVASEIGALDGVGTTRTYIALD